MFKSNISNAVHYMVCKLNNGCNVYNEKSLTENTKVPSNLNASIDIIRGMLYDARETYEIIHGKPTYVRIFVRYDKYVYGGDVNIRDLNFFDFARSISTFLYKFDSLDKHKIIFYNNEQIDPFTKIPILTLNILNSYEILNAYYTGITRYTEADAIEFMRLCIEQSKFNTFSYDNLVHKNIEKLETLINYYKNEYMNGSQLNFLHYNKKIVDTICL